jgi:hypothetical protein
VLVENVFDRAALFHFHPHLTVETANRAQADRGIAAEVGI